MNALEIDELGKNTLALLPEALQPTIEAYVTIRLVAFHQAMVERGQVKQIPVGQNSVIVGCKQD
jgi:hypothetical protein